MMRKIWPTFATCSAYTNSTGLIACAAVSAGVALVLQPAVLARCGIVVPPKAAFRSAVNVEAIMMIKAMPWTQSSSFSAHDQAVLQEAKDIIARYWAARSPNVLNAPNLVKMYCQCHLAHVDREVFGALWLDNGLRALGTVDLFAGSLNHAAVHTREVLRSGLRLNAAAVIFYHNHPSGDPSPSQADRQLTNHLKDVLGQIEIRVLDHMVVSLSGVVSFAERGWC
ncbi:MULTISPECIES: JAB domain-containing protein [Vibrio]|nr:MULTISPECIES: JAB domain-containing protein [Vibrio]EEX34477.1 DNA repair protein RadC [Vibrio coralliilyticus ATCC BAA-450]